MIFKTQILLEFINEIFYFIYLKKFKMLNKYLQGAPKNQTFMEQKVDITAYMQNSKLNFGTKVIFYV